LFIPTDPAQEPIYEGPI